MPTERLERRLAAILAVDMIGYSRLMGADEAGTLARLKAYRSGLIDPKLAEYGGRVVKLTGDGMLVEFASVVDAVQCAFAVQQAVTQRNAGDPEDQRVAFRIGLNLGDVIIDGDDIYGEGVNVAARLEGLAEPGGVCISGTVFDHVRKKVPLAFEDLGDHAVKNIPEPVRVYRVLMDPKAGTAATADPAPPVSPPSSAARGVRRALTALAALVVVVAAGLAWQLGLLVPAPPDDPAAGGEAALALPDLPSIAVLPFTNLSDDPTQEYFVDGMTEDLITDLSKVSGLFVIARNSVFVYKGRAVSIPQVASELGVRYVLEGSVRRVGDAVRINAQLIDAISGGHLWAERYDGEMADVFAFQDTVTRQIVVALAVELTAGEQTGVSGGETGDPAAYDAFLRGWEHFRRRTPQDHATALSYFESALELDPGYSRAHAALATVYWEVVFRRWGWALAATGLGGTGGVFLVVEAERLAEEHLQISMAEPTALAHRLASSMRAYRYRHAEAVVEAGRAVALDPNGAESHVAMALALIWAGRPEEAPAFVERAKRLDPFYPAGFESVLGLANFAMGRSVEALAFFEAALERNPDDRSLFLPLAAVQISLGRTADAEASMDLFLANFGWEGRYPYADVVPFLRYWPFRDAEVVERFGFAALAAGMCCRQEDVTDFIDRMREEGKIE